VNECRLKLGGKDPAYVRQDADIAYTAAELVDGEERSVAFMGKQPHLFSGAFFNSGQSCCSVEVRAVGT
jgi:acyl-CoA reductase-like NAD-dependent aldehyde dehydrogenase